MDVFSIFTLLGGLAFFLYGMNVMSNGLEKMTGGKLEKTLKMMTSNPVKSLLLGAGITIAIQSSSAMTVMLVGFVNSGIMELGQTIGVIMGSNIGTTLTAWVLSLAGVESNNFFLKLLNPSAFSPIVALIGIVLIMVSKSSKKKDIGTIMLGFSILMSGMDAMSDAMSPLADMPEFAHLLVAFRNPLLGVLVGAIFTGIIQSSAASVGILQALSLTGNITVGMAMPIIMGQNIGTCVTAILSSIGVNKNAKRVAAVHIYFNLIGTVVCLMSFYTLNAILHFDFVEGAITPVGVAAVHSIFNIVTTLILFPFSKQLERLARKTIKTQDEDKGKAFLDERLLATPSVAIAACKELAIEMSDVVRQIIMDAIQIVEVYSEQQAQSIKENENLIDQYEDRLGTYLVKLGSKELSEADGKEVSKILHIIGDFERIGDHALNICQVAQELHDKKLSFSDEAKAEITTLTKAITEIISISIEAFVNNDIKLAKKVEPLEEVIDVLNYDLKDRHIKRLKKGTCTIEQGFIFTDLLTNYERVSDHCSNIAVCIIEVNESSFETHEYILNLKTAGKEEFNREYEIYKKKYDLA